MGTKKVMNTSKELIAKLSDTSKMPCRSWSLAALTTCPASKKSNGELVDACAGCYATTGAYTWTAAKNVRKGNQDGWMDSDWVEAMAKAISKEPSGVFRWFDSGDLYSISLAEKVFEVCKATPNIKHWIPTRMHKFPKFKEVLERLQRLDNVVVRYSSDSVSGKTIKGLTTSTIISNMNQLPENAVVCNSDKQGNKCEDCRACWDKSVPVVAYKAHGDKMSNVIARG